MSRPDAIVVEDLGKRYRLGLVGSGTFHEDLSRWWARVRGRRDPLAEVGARNDRDRAAESGEGAYVWALRNVSFRVARGEAVGIIGANGAGKSTLLKLLSRVTAPSAGSLRMRGRVASLLEVGTGFHRELTGRENVYLNGTILGLTRQEVDARIGDIFAFAGVERYGDTPVKRYSTGMTVRLAFAVAAHLDPDVLIVDEVLAVGDAEFQRKAVGKLREVAAGTERAVLFVSHNMEAIARLCTRAIVLDRGAVAFDGSAVEGIRRYAELNFGRAEAVDLSERTDRKGRGPARFSSFEACDAAGAPLPCASPGQTLRLRCGIRVASGERVEVYAGIGLRDGDGAPYTMLASWARAQTLTVADGSVIEFAIPALGATEGEYLVDLFLEAAGPGATVLDQVEAAATLLIEGRDFFGSGQVVTDYRYRYFEDFTVSVAD